ncbi:SLAM family member 9 isoform X2 [Amia ocellicauda]|uniref:SLAM family member 9 isoform X2 n=1 Tax=Amia ocellicauda TaxID=2972642 RepID=UPI0034640DBC
MYLPVFETVFSTEQIFMGTGIPAIELYGLKGDSIGLEVQGHEQLQFKSISWKFNKVNIVEYNTKYDDVDYEDTYKPRVEFSKENKSLTIRNLEETDHGLYTAVMVNNDKVDVTVAKYSLLIQEKIDTPVMVVDSNFSSSKTCNILITCSVKGKLSSTFICNDSLCREETRNKSAAVVINVSAVDSFFMCNASNHVSWTHSSLGKEKLCPSAEQNQILTAVIVAACVLCLILIMVICVIIKSSCKKYIDTEGISSTYATVQNDGQEKNAKLPETRYTVVRKDRFISQQKGEDPTSIYSTVQNKNVRMNSIL